MAACGRHLKGTNNSGITFPLDNQAPRSRLHHSLVQQLQNHLSPLKVARKRISSRTEVLMKRMAGGGQGKKAQAKISHPNRALSDVNLSDTASSSSSEQQPVAGPSSRRREVESESDSDSDSDVEVIVTKKPAQAAVSGKRARHEDTSIDSTEEEPPPPRKRPKPKPIPKTRPRKPNNTLNPRAAGRNPSEDAVCCSYRPLIAPVLPCLLHF